MRILNLFKTILLILATIVGVSQSFAGTPDKDELDRARKEFPNADAVFFT